MLGANEAEKGKNGAKMGPEDADTKAKQSQQIRSRH